MTMPTAPGGGPPSEQRWPGLLGDERLTAAERKRLVEDRVLAAAAADTTDQYTAQVADEVREQREATERRAQWAAVEAERLPALDAPAAVEQITHATTPDEVALIATRLHGHDLHRAAQVLGISSTQLPPTPISSGSATCSSTSWPTKCPSGAVVAANVCGG